MKGAATRRQKTASRDVELALEYVHDRKPNGSTAANTTLMKRIGKRHDLSPTWSIEVVRRGLRLLRVQSEEWADCKRFQEQNRDAWLAYWDGDSRDIAELMRRLKVIVVQAG